MSKTLLVLLTTVFIFFLLASTSLGHGLGQILTKETEKYVVELEYEALEVTDEEPVEYVFRIIEKESQKRADFESVAVRVMNKITDRGVFSTTISAKDALGLGPRVYMKLEKGDYSFTIIFIKGDEELVKESFDITVLPGDKKNKDLIIPLVGFTAGVTVAGAGMIIFRKRK